ncbi:hypothetical protein IFM89_014966 [Coptis chinensis]|uniref:Uncharacterized protein n=1 Tax=Coptis chinensis TaxID=261450 RepID=A0A835HL75_9MAGN|nr:hypothetical protein IFM89_014966 [Coptis chinensis]
MPLLVPILFLIFSILLLSFLSISLYKKLKKTDEENAAAHVSFSTIKLSISSTIDKLQHNNKPLSLFLHIANSNTNLASLLSHCDDEKEKGNVSNELNKDVGGDLLLVGEEESGKKKKKKKKKKRGKKNKCGEEIVSIERCVTDLQHKHCLDCLYPFTSSSSSATQRKIKQQYDQLVKSNGSKGLTMVQSILKGRCLAIGLESEAIKRKFTITKALLLKAHRSSFDRLSQQLHKLEAEQKRLEEDANIYNRLQQQLKLSPAYKKMLEVGARMELKASSDQLTKNMDSEISFEELLAREKKDSFWQKNGKLRSCMS